MFLGTPTPRTPGGGEEFRVPPEPPDSLAIMFTHGIMSELHTKLNLLLLR